MSLNDIIEIQEQKREREIKIYKMIYDKIRAKINNFASMDSVACYYEIPPYIFGYPLINIPRAMEYCLAKLNKNNFIAFQVSDNIIYISWELSAIEAQKKRKSEIEKVRKSKILLEDIDKQKDIGITDVFLKHKRPELENKNKNKK